MLTPKLKCRRLFAGIPDTETSQCLQGCPGLSVIFAV